MLVDVFELKRLELGRLSAAKPCAGSPSDDEPSLQAQNIIKQLEILRKENEHMNVKVCSCAVLNEQVLHDYTITHLQRHIRPISR